MLLEEGLVSNLMKMVAWMSADARSEKVHQQIMPTLTALFSVSYVMLKQLDLVQIHEQVAKS